ncbi:hypothetical protein BKA70DRAFT_1413291 [Coprinopsis sp. MPI-PUGE-AT-0042]|nr:hypothetical protein BKA70DRAFT_1413291 [Coprinopsis sp. MPI-PUGE-AT-0042]
MNLFLAFLKPSLVAYLERLNLQDQACGRDYQRIENAIEEKQSMVQALEREIRRLETIKDRLVATRESISLSKTQFTATVSPVRRMPPEIIAEIIAFATQRGFDGCTEAAERRHFQKLRAVCRLWRQTALSTPYLWRSVGIATSDFTPRRVVDGHTEDALAQSLTCWFSRGGDSAPLNLFLRWVSLNRATRAFQIIRQSKMNVTSATVAIDGVSHNSLEFLVPSPKEDSGTLPLKKVFIHLEPPGEHVDPRETLDLTRHLPHLSTIALSFSPESAFAPASLIHQTLSELLLQRIHLPSDEIKFVLSGLPQLEYLRLARCTPVLLDEEDTTAVPYIHPTLRRVALHRGIPQPFVSGLTCPSLSSLVVTGDTPQDKEMELELAFLHRFIQRSNEPLPETLKPSLSAYLNRLEHQDQVCNCNYQRLEEAIEEKQSIIRALEDQIQRLEAVKTRIFTTRASLSQSKARYTATVSALRRIPPEVIANIIAFAISGYDGFVGAEERQFFQKLRAVCRLWRQTALSTPYLWRCVGLGVCDFPPRRGHKEDPLTQPLTSWFSRGGYSAPVNLFLSWVSVDHATRAFQIMRQSGLNLTSATVSINGTTHNNLKFLAPSQTERGGILPLEELFIHLDTPSQRSDSQKSLDLTHHLPHLSSLLLSFPRSPAFVPASITHKTLSALFIRRICLPSEEVESVLAGLPRLETLSLTRCTQFWSDEPDPTVTPYVHPTITRVGFHSGIPQPFLSRLTCPSLTSLVVEGNAREDQQEIELAILQGFVNRCCGPVELTFYDEAPRMLGP